MNIEIKKSIKPIKYDFAISYMEKRLEQISKGEGSELIWILEHDEIYTGGTSYKQNEILDKSINFIKTNRGGKITYHGSGQLVFYFVINLKKRQINIRKLIDSIEKTIIDTLYDFNIKSFADRKNIGIWNKKNNIEKKVGAIGIRIKKWIAYHGFSLNISNDTKNYRKIIPCGIKSKGIATLKEIKNQNYNDLPDEIVNSLISNLKF